MIKRALLASLGFFAMSATLFAQEPEITPQTPVNSEILHQWLQSGDPRRIAWAADFAQKTHDARTLSEMPALLEHWTIPQGDDLSEAEQDQRLAAMAVLDALIQQKLDTPIPVIRAIARSFPDQAAILISRVPLNESGATLGQWMNGATGAWDGRALARVATMMWAQVGNAGSIAAPYTAFVGSVVSAAEDELRVSIRSADNAGSTGGSAACGDWLGGAARAGWPAVFKYALVENDPDPRAELVVELEGDRIQYQRTDTRQGGGTCHAIEWLDSTTRHRIIAYWLGIKPVKMKWQPTVEKTIVWTDKTAYERQLGALTEAEHAKLHATAVALNARGLLQADQVNNVSPRLVVKIQCEIDPCPLK